MKFFSALIMLVLSVFTVFAQEPPRPKGSLYFTWGYHRDQYSRSTIHFRDETTDDYAFTFYHAKAHDRADMDHLLQSPPTVPQYVFNAGYFFNNKRDLGIEVSWDHLKYIVADNQMMHMKGSIRGKTYDLDTLVTPDFVHLEHTNGNNYLMISLVKRHTLTNPQAPRKLSLLFKAGGGALIPKTDSNIMGGNNDGPFRFSGYMVGVSTNLRYDLFKYFFIEGGVKGAFVHYTAIKLVNDGRAKQTFFSVQYIWAAGINIPL